MKKRILSVLLTVCMVLTMMPLTGSTAEALNAQSLKFDKILNPSLPSTYNAASTEDPYMEGKDNAFLLSEQDESLLYLQYNGDERGTVTQNVGDTFKMGSVDSDSRKCDNQPMKMNTDSYQGTTTLAEGPQGMSYVKAVSFDPTGSGRKDHVAYVGFDVDTNKIETWVMDAKGDSKNNATYSTPVALSGEIKNAWIHLKQYTYGAYFSITAGDYDGDHKDSYVVYCPGTDNINPQLYEFTLSSGSYTQSENIDVVAKGLYNEAGMKNQEPIAYSGDKEKSYTQMITMSLTTGDFDGDGLDELGTASGTYRLDGDGDSHPRGLWGDKATYTTQVCVMDKTSSGFSRTANFDMADQTEKTDDKTTYQMLYAGQIAAGDVDGDGKDEIVAAGATGTASVTSTFSWSDLYERKKDYYATATISYSNSAYGRTVLVETPTNGFTKAHFDNNKGSWPVAAIACVSLNGASAADDVFLSGTLYTVEGGSLKSAFEPDFFGGQDDLSVISVQDHWVDSVAVGNFDGNSAGRQQVLFSICEKDTDKENYLYKVGIIGGSTYGDVYSGGKITSYGTVTSYYYSNLNDNASKMYDGGRGNAWWDNKKLVLNCLPIAVDRDNDGVMAKYTGKSCIYTDPSVLAVLQAAPYFGELGGYSDFNGTTTYSLTTAYTYGKTSSDNVSFGFGFAGDLQAGPVALSLEAGYTLNWTKSFEHSLTTSYSTTFTAGPYDQVILQRTPATVYRYSVKDANGNYIPDSYQFTVPLEPVYTKLSVNEYNNFVDYYTTWYETNITNNSNISSSLKDSTVLLKKLDSTNPVLPDDNEGNPSAYRDSWTPRTIGTSAISDQAESLSKGQYTLDHSAGSTTSDWSVESSSTKSITFNHGFHFSLTVQGGVQNVFAAGAYANLDYSHGAGSYNTTTKAAEASGTVGDIDSPALEAKGIPDSVSSIYGFSWSFGKWEGDLGGTCLNSGVRDANRNPYFDGNVPFFGYAVTNISMPPAPITSLTAELSSDNSANLSWNTSAVLNRPVTSYNVYSVSNGNYTQLNSNPLTETSYIADGLDSSSTDYSFVVTAVSNDGESIWSNVATVTTPRQYYTLTMTGQVSVSAGYEGMSVQSGGKCPEDSIVYISAKALDGYALTGYTIGNGTPFSFEPCESRSFNFRFPSADTTVTFSTQQVNSSITFKPDDPANGSVTATVGGSQIDSNGGTVTDIVTIQATPNAGKILVGWEITETDSSGVSTTITIADDGTGILKLNPVKSGYSITADFEDAGSTAAQKTITINTPKFGNIEVTDSTGSALTPNSSNQIKVVLNSSLTFKAVPAEFYTFKGWTGGSFSGTENPHMVTVTQDMTVGADFSAPVMYKVTYAADPTDSGIISALCGTASVASEDAVAKGSLLKFTAAPKTSYAFEGWTVDGSADSSAADNLSLTITKNTIVTAQFVTTHTITASAGTGGNITPDGASIIKDGGEITYHIEANKGYEIGDVLVDGVSVGKKSGYDFSGVKADHTISAVFTVVATPPVTPPSPPVTPPGTPTSYTVPANSDSGSTNVDTTISGTTATIAATAEQKAAVASEDKTTGTVNIDLTGAKVDAAVIPSDFVEAVQNAKDSKGISVAMPTGTLSMDKTALDSIGKGSEIQIDVRTKEKSELNSEQQGKITEAIESGIVANESSMIIVDANISVNGAETHTFNGGSIIISIPYTLKEGEDPEKITVWYLADDGTLTAMHGNYDAATKMVSFTTTHLSVYAAGSISEERLSGQTRYDTMSEIVKKAFPNGSDTAVLASGENFPDALTASSLAGALSCPILLTNPNSLSSQASALLMTLGTKQVYIVGGTSAVTGNVKEDLIRTGIDENSIEQIGGDDRVQTAEKIEDKVLTLTSADTCIIASGANYPDALSISAYAYKNKIPVLLTGSGNRLTDSTLTLAKKFAKAIIVGGPNAVSTDVETQLEGVSSVRYGGSDRYDTSRQIINQLFSGRISVLAAATGNGFPDALAGASVAGMAGGAVLLVDGTAASLTDDEKAVFSKANITYVLGGPSAVADKLEGSVIDAMK
jgi:putative cell wall-binding protein